MPSTYEPIATTTLGSAAASITFSSIPSTYTDLKIVFVGTATLSGINANVRFNSDTASNYSNTALGGDGSTAQSVSATSQTYNQLTVFNGINGTIPTLRTMDIFSYAGSTYKTCLTTESNDFNGSGSSARTVQLWRSASAINTILIYASSSTFTTGTTATLYGIKNA